MRVLVLGGSGMLGHKLVQVLAGARGLDVHCTVRRPPDRGFAVESATYHTDIQILPDTARLQELIVRLQPAVIVNAVGAIKQRNLGDAADETFFINGTLPHLLAFLAGRHGRVITFSTDCVFSGTRGAYTERDEPDAVDLYGRSKLAGEVDYRPHLTIRTSIIGFEIAGHLGLVSWFLRTPRDRPVAVYSQATFSGLPTVTLSKAVRELIVGGSPLYGVYNVASEPITKADLLARINDAMNLQRMLEEDASLVIDRSLDDSRFRRATDTVTPGWNALVQDLVEDYASLPYNQIYEGN